MDADFELSQQRTVLSLSGIEFTLLQGHGGTLRFPLPGEAASGASPAALALEALWVEERLVETADGYSLPFPELYRLDLAEARALGLPLQATDVDAELVTSGYAGGTGFSIRAVIRDSSGVVLPESSRRGPVFQTAEGLVLMPEPVAPLLARLDAGCGSTLADHFLAVGEVRRLADRCGARLDRYLSTQEILTPDGIGVAVEAHGPDEMELSPVLEGIEPGRFAAFGRAGPTRAVEMEVDGTRRVRMVLTPEERATVDAVKQRTRLSGPDVPRFLDNPEAFVPDGIDLSRFSLRVRGLVPRRYNSQPYVRLQPTAKRDWFAMDVRVELAESFFDGPSRSGGDAAPVPPAQAGAPEAGFPQGEPAAAAPISAAEYAGLCEAVRSTGERYQLHAGRWIEIDPHAAERYLRAWEASQDDGAGGRWIAPDRVRLVLDVISNVEELEFDAPAPRRALIPDVPEYPLPGALQAELLPHQQVGYRWMRYLHEHGFGGLLADDMGLGKTVQVISLLAHLADAGQLQPALVVLPVSLIENWRRELARFCPRIRRVYVHQGPGRARSPELLAQWEVVLTTYETLRRDQLVLGQVDWSVIACDEAQKVKNPTAQATSAIKGMKARLRLAMTGTPVENGLSELWCIVDWAQPGKVGSQREFRESYERPMRDADESGRAVLAERLQHQLTPHYIRRVKEDVLKGLPARSEARYEVPMGSRQQRLYARVIQQVRAGGMIPIEGLQHLLAIASHPELFEDSGAPIESLVEECPKLSKTLELLRPVRDGGEKVVIFTRFRRMQQILQQALATQFGIHAAILNGEVPGERRLGLVDRFNHAPGFGALILSPEAAGVGLNIVGANHVVHYTRLWNPARENQATDRVHRIGQSRPVTVHYPIVRGGELPGVEERLAVLLDEKQALARDVVRPRESLSVERELFQIFQQDNAP
jgi:hypothetical protein